MVMDIVSFADWKRMEFKVGKVLAAEKVAGADKLLKLTVNTGEERTLVAGVAAVYSPEELVGTEVVVFANLEPKPLKGIMSEGMLLAVGDEDGRPILLRPEREVPAGSKVS